MRTSTKVAIGTFVFIILFILLGMYGNAPRFSSPSSGPSSGTEPGTTITNEPMLPNQGLGNQHHAFPQGPVPNVQQHTPQGVQVIRSLLGLEVKFLNGNVNYPGPLIVNDPRYQALVNNEKLVDSILFKPNNAPPFLLLVAIAKSATGEPIIVPGKFDIVRKTEQDGLVLKDPKGHIVYYSGYLLATPAWKSLGAGQSLFDKFCKDPVPMILCTPKNTVNVILKKPQDPNKDIPMLALVQ